MKKYLTVDFLLAVEIVIIGMAEAAHLAALTLGWTFSSCMLLFGGLAGGTVLFSGVCVLLRHRGVWGKGHLAEGGEPLLRRGTAFLRSPEVCCYALFGAVLLSQLIFICIGDTNYRGGDMTVETAASFLEEDGLYRVNPMTGAPYTGGIPSRLKILCLPTLYACLSGMTGLSVRIVVWKLVPIAVLASSYGAFGLLAAALFPEEEAGGFREKRACFMTAVSLLMWAGAYQAGIDGFQLLCGGWRGVTIRNLVLLPWLLSLCLRRKWLAALLCIPAEACIVWTLYGCGVCLPVWLGMAGLRLWGKYAAHSKARKT